jgi:hypothetical protein
MFHHEVKHRVWRWWLSFVVENEFIEVETADCIPLFSRRPYKQANKAAARPIRHQAISEHKFSALEFAVDQRWY